MRIIGGQARGRQIRAPQGAGTRPTGDRVRESIFNVLGQRFEGGRVLDLYAGSGAMALEALSRGADEAVLVERDRNAARICEENVRSLGYGTRARIVRGSAPEVLGRLRGPFDLVFIDPPYEDGPAAALERLGEGDLVAPGGRVVAEHDRRTELADTFGFLERMDLRRFGDTAVSFFERTTQETK